LYEQAPQLELESQMPPLVQQQGQESKMALHVQHQKKESKMAPLFQ
jgi:hypothetical protein